MKLYQYKALNRAGLTVSAVISAADGESVVSRLKRINLHPVSIKQRSVKSVVANRLTSRGSRRRLSIDLTLQLSSLMQSGLPLDAALSELVKSDNAQLSSLAGTILNSIQRGEQLAATLSTLNLLSAGHCRAIAVAEKSDCLATGLANVAEGLQLQQQFRQRIQQACLYPAVLILVLGGLMGYLSLAVVPQLLQFSVGLGQEIPRSAYLLQQTAQLAGDYFLSVVILFCLSLVAVLVGIRLSPLLKLRVDELTLRLPLTGCIVLFVWRARFFAELRSLLDAGVDLIEALALLEGSSKNTFIRTHLAVLRREVQDGRRLSEAMRCTALFTSVTLQRIQLGELTGDYSNALRSEAETSRQAVRRWLTKLEDRVAPVLLSVCGLLILWIIVAVIAPVYSAAIGAGALL